MNEVVYLLSVDSLDGADTPQTLRFSMGQYDADGEAWEPRLAQPALQSSSAFTSLLPVPNFTGRAVLVNPDGGLDYLIDFAIDGRQALIQTWDGTTLRTVSRATALGWQWDQDEVILLLRDPVDPLRLPYPQDVFAGDNALPSGVEGTADDLKGKRKPVCLGDVRSCAPVMVNTARLIYLGSTGTVGIDAVYDQGVPLTDDGEAASLAALESSTPSAGHYKRFEGYFKLGASPVGLITADISQPSVTLADVFDFVVSEASSFTVSASDLAALPAYDVGLHVSDSTSTFDLLMRLADSAGCYWWLEGTEVRIRQLVAPSSPARTVEAFESSRVTRQATAGGAKGLPVWRVSLDCDEIVQTQDDPAAAVSDATRARLASQFRAAVEQDTAVQARHPLADEVEITTALRAMADGETEAARLEALLSVRRDMVDADIAIEGEGLSVGAEITFQSRRFGYAAGREMVVLSVTTDARTRVQTVRLWG